MADRYLLESGAPDGYRLEDNSGVLLLDKPSGSRSLLAFWLGGAGILTNAAVTANPTGVAGTGAVGSLAISGKANVALTGVAGTGSPGSVTIAAQATQALSGVSATGAVGTLSVVGLANVPLTGVAGTGAVGTLALSGKSVVTITGVAGTGSVGTITVPQSTQGVRSLLAFWAGGGAYTATGGVTVAILGTSATGLAGQLAPLVASPTLWTPNWQRAHHPRSDFRRLRRSFARDSWNTVPPPVGVAVSFTLTGVQAAAAVGAVTVTGAASIAPTGVAGTGSAGALTLLGKATLALAGVEGAGQLGTLTVQTAGNVTVALTGLAGTGAVGALSTATSITVTMPAVTATGAAGTLLVSGKANVPLTAVEAQALVGSLATIVGNLVANDDRIIHVILDGRVVEIELSARVISVGPVNRTIN